MVLGYIGKFVATVVFVYLAWRKMRGDLVDNVSVFLWLCVASFLIGGRLIWSALKLTSWQNNLWDWIFFWDNPGFSLEAGIVCGIGFVFVYSLFDRFNLFELAEDLVVPFLFGVAIWLLTGVFDVHKVDWWLFGVVVLVYVQTFWARRYRSFFWYKSGKKGFLFLSSGLFANLLRVVVDLCTKRGTYLIYLNLAFSLLFFVGLVILGELFGQKKNE